MLIIKGKPIRTCLDYYEHFDVSEVLKQPQALYVFAKGHLNFDQVSNHCIEIIRQALLGNLPPLLSPAAFWQGKEIERPKHIKSILDESYTYYKCLKKSDDWEFSFAVASAATLLAGKKQFCPSEMLPQRSDKYEPVDLSQEVISLTSGKHYQCAYDPDLIMEEGALLRTVKFQTEGSDKVPAILHVGEMEIKLPFGAFSYANVCDNTVVKLLPDKITLKNETFWRDYYRGVIMCGKTEMPIPVEASSFAVLKNGVYLYINDGQLYRSVQISTMLGLGSDDWDFALPSFLTQGDVVYVEVGVYDGQYYLLTNEGIITTSNGTPDELCSYYASLSQVFKEDEL